MPSRNVYRHFFYLLTLLAMSAGLAGCPFDDDDDAPPPPPPASSDADLASLTVSEGSLDPAFSAAVTDYALTLAHAVESITVTATTSDAAASLTINGTATSSGSASAPVDLPVGTTQIDIVVTAEDGTTTKSYAVNVTREASSDASLSALELSATVLNESFDAAQDTYTADVDNSVDSTTVTATASDASATITVNGMAVASGAASDPVPLAVGDNLITVTVTAEDGTTTESYTITVARAAPPVMTSSVSVLVLDDSGGLVPGATLNVESSGETDTTGSDGRASVPVIQQSRELIRISAPGYLPQTLLLDLPANAQPSVFKAGLIAEADPQQIVAAESGGTASGGDGASVTLPAGALVDSSGNPVTGSVDVFVTPLDVSDDRAFLAFPGGFEAENASGEAGFMLSFGTGDFRFEQGGAELSIADGQTATIELPLYVPNDADGAALTEGVAIALWSLDETTSLWIEEGQGTVVASAASPTGLALRGDVTHFSWWNADRFRDGATIDIRGNCESLGLSCGELEVNANLECKSGGNGRPRYVARFGLQNGATAPDLPVPGGTDLDCTVDTDGAYTADSIPDPVNAPAGTLLDVELVLSPRYLSGDLFTPGERLRGELNAIGETHSFRFNGFAGETFEATAYPALTGNSQPGLTGTLDATVSVYSDTTLLASASFDSTIAGEVELELPTDGEFEIRFTANGNVPGWYLATTRIRPPAATGEAGKVAFLAFNRTEGTFGIPGRRLYTVPEGASPYLELSGEFVNPDPVDTNGVRGRNPSFDSARELPYYQEVVPGRIIYLADQDVPDKFELYMVEIENPGVSVKLNGSETGDASSFFQISDFKVSEADPTHVVYTLGGQDSGDEIWFVDTDDPGNSVRLGEPVGDDFYDGRQRHFELVDGGAAVVYQTGSTVQTRLNDGDLYLVQLDNPGVATRLSAPLDAAAGETVQRFDTESAISPNGQFVAYVANFTEAVSELLLVDIANPGNPVRVDIIPGGDDRVLNTQFTPDNSKLVVEKARFGGASSGPLYLVDISDPANPGDAVQLSDSVSRRIVVSPDSSFALELGNDEIERFDFATPGTTTVEWSIPNSAAGESQFTTDGTGIVMMVRDLGNNTVQLFLHQLGEPADSQLRLGPLAERLTDSRDGIIDFELAADGTTVYYMLDLVVDEREIFQTTLTNPDADRQVVVESLDRFPLAPQDGGVPSFIILEAGQNTGP